MENMPESYQLCPKCNGQGFTEKPPYVAGDVNHWSSTSLTHTCSLCEGKGYIIALRKDKASRD